MNLLASAFAGLTILLSASADASEGLFINPQDLPKSVQPYWESTFLFVSDTRAPAFGGMGTAFVVGVTANAMYLVTNNHVVDFQCPQNGFCPKSVAVAQESSINWDDDVFSIKSLQNIFRNIEVIDRTFDPDLALLKVVIPKDRTAPRSVRIATNCTLRRSQNLYGIGFPATALRTDPNAKPIPDQGTFRKRWAQGVYFKRDNEFIDGKSRTTVDSLEGMSGRPLFDQNGFVIGVGLESVATASNQFAYAGKDGFFSSLLGHSKMIDCDVVRDFVEKHRAKYRF